MHLYEVLINSWSLTTKMKEDLLVMINNDLTLDNEERKRLIELLMSKKIKSNFLHDEYLPYNYERRIERELRRPIKPDKDLEEEQLHSGPCFIATHVYEDFNHPHVIKLRKLRNKLVGKSNFYKKLNDLYYFMGPSILKLMGNSLLIKKLIRLILSKLIKVVG